MSYVLSENPKETIRQLLVDSITPSNIQGYDPSQTNTTESDFFPITNDWPAGDYYPIVSITNTSSNIVGGGDLPFTGMQGDGSGLNQEHIDTVEVTIHASGDVSYRNGVDRDTIAWDISQEINRVINDENFDSPSNGEIWAFAVEGFVDTTPQSDSSSFTQLTGTAYIQYLLEAT